VAFDVVRYPHGPWRDLLAEAHRLEAAGAGTLWLADHPERPHVLEPWTALAALAATTGLSLGTAATNASLRDPALLAAQVRTVAEIAGGRLEVAVGAGDGGGVETIRAALDAIEGVPLYVAANARRGLELAAERPVGSLSQGRGVQARMAFLRELGVRERLLFVGWGDERPFVSEASLRAFVEQQRAAGVTRFLWTYAPNDDKNGRFLSRATLDRYAPLLADWTSPDDDEEVRDT
jgi:hypothetical protein